MDEEDEFQIRPLGKEEVPEIPEVKFEYLDHPADVQLHACGDSLEESFEQVAMAMFGVVTELDTVEMQKQYVVEASGHDLMSLLYNFLNELLYVFSADPFLIPRVVRITNVDWEGFTITASGYGESFDIQKHPQGTEVKAITYSAMQIHDSLPTHDIYVIVDI